MGVLTPPAQPRTSETKSGKKPPFLFVYAGLGLLELLGEVIGVPKLGRQPTSPREAVTGRRYLVVFGDIVTGSWH